MCVISNVKTQVCKSIEDHPIKNYYDKRLIVTVNSDDPTMFNTSITREYTVLVEELGFFIEDIKKLGVNGIRSTFMSDQDKESMISLFEKEWINL